MSTVPLRVVHYGLGSIGLEIAKLVSLRGALRSVGAIDVDPELSGRYLGELTGATPSGVIVQGAGAVLPRARGAVVAHCTGSSLERVLPQLLDCVERGLSVVSTCEELSYPWDQAPGPAAELDAAAAANGVTVLGAGVNPGFAMDYLPVVLSGASRRVDHVRVHRAQDAAMRRVPLQKKVGAGLSLEQFEELVQAGTVRHVGLPESAQAVAAAFGWRLTELRDEIEPVVAERPTCGALGEIAAGAAAGVRQRATGFVDGREVVDLTLEMAVGLADPRDEVTLGGDPDVSMIIPGGLHGDIATAAVVVNAIPLVARAAPGLRVMAELPPPRPDGWR
jgi:4-hydroxy-tetrahydrodipicolinate reductase